jgi:hypothetical protein
MPDHPFFEYEFNEEVAERAARSFEQALSPNLGAKFWRAFPFVLVPCLAFGALTLIGDRSDLPETILWGVSLGMAVLFGAAAALMVLLQLFIIAAMRFAHWRTRRDLRRWTLNLRDPNVRWEFADESFTTHVDGIERRTNWNDVQRVLMDEDFWMFAIKDGPHLFLPVARLSNEIKEIIRARTSPESTTFPSMAG